MATGKIVYVVGFVLALLGIVAIILSSLKYESTKTEQVKGRFGIIIDAGGSGTRLIIYEYSKDDTIHQVKYTECEDKGLTKYASHPDAIRGILAKCLDGAEKYVPKQVINSIPVNMEATAGMRLFKLTNESAYDKILASSSDAIRKSHFKYVSARTIKGSKEAIDGWTALNYIQDGFKQNKLSGALELGSSSLQVSFIPARKDFNGENETITINGKQYTVYVHSYLCYGRSEFERRYLAKLAMDSGFSATIDDPCAHKGREVQKTSDYLWAVPCCSGSYALRTFGIELKGPPNRTFIFRGQSNFTQCQEMVTRLFNKTRCTQPGCTFNDVSQPPLFGHFVAFSAFYYPISFLNLSSSVSRSDYEAASKRICSMTGAEVKEIPGSEKFKYTYCLSSVYATSFLTNGIHFNDSSWKILFKRKVNGQKISWSLGSQLLKKDEMSAPIFKTIHSLLTETDFILITTISSLAILVGIIMIIIMYIRRRRRKPQGAL